MMTDTRSSHSNRPPVLQIFGSGHDNYKSSAQVVIITNYHLGVAGGKIIEDTSAVANLNQPNIRHGMTGIPTFAAVPIGFCDGKCVHEPILHEQRFVHHCRRHGLVPRCTLLQMIDCRLREPQVVLLASHRHAIFVRIPISFSVPEVTLRPPLRP